MTERPAVPSNDLFCVGRQAIHTGIQFEQRGGRVICHKRSDIRRIRLRGLSRPLEFDGCVDVAADLLQILVGWDVEDVEPGIGPEPLVTFRRRKKRVKWISDFLPPPDDWKTDPPRKRFYAMCDIRYELSDWFLADNPNYLCVHCAAVQFGESLVVFPSPVRAGKSTLAVQLAAAGHTVFADDVLPIEPKTEHGMSLGVLPRVRLPLPKAVARSLEPFLAERQGPACRDYSYVALCNGEMAPFGKTAPIRAFVLLDRREDEEADIASVTAGEMLKWVIRRNFAEDLPTPRIFARFQHLVTNAKRLRLTYSDGADAIARLTSLFGKPVGRP